MAMQGSKGCSALYAVAFDFRKRTALGVPGAEPLARAMSQTLHQCALAFFFYALFFSVERLLSAPIFRSCSKLDDVLFRD
ncbi:hypothetical protein J7432_09945 [Xanthomonas axonopodis pv. begoniae]|nr:hypothetical protein [Xanthomonas axonopodis pv. begoniae]MBO9773289.1 hypothetical protein [Xanthomonas axonopodis pv. begoniae]